MIVHRLKTAVAPRMRMRARAWRVRVRRDTRVERRRRILGGNQKGPC